MSALLEPDLLARLAPGFAEPVRQSQAVFRVLLEALARPGRLQSLTGALQPGLGQPADLPPALAAALLTLLDADIRLWISPGLDSAELRAWCRFHSAPQWAEAPETADFALLDAAEARPELLQRLRAGSDERPQDSATALIAVRTLVAAGDQCWRGPGIEHEHQPGIAGLDAGFWAWRRSQQALYPCGVDFVFFAAEGLLGLPRTTEVC